MVVAVNSFVSVYCVYVLTAITALCSSTSVEISPNKGGTFFLPHIDGKIEIQKGAVKTPCSLKMDQCFDPGILPDGTEPVGYGLGLHLNEDQPLRPNSITATLPHYLETTTRKDGTALKLGVMKVCPDAAGVNEFKKLNTAVEVDDKYATFTPDLGYSVLYAEVKSEEDLGMNYCICPVFPSFARLKDQASSTFYYCLMYNDTKLKKVGISSC